MRDFTDVPFLFGPFDLITLCWVYLQLGAGKKIDRIFGRENVVGLCQIHVDVIATFDPAKTLDACIAYIQEGFDVQIDGLRAHPRKQT